MASPVFIMRQCRPALFLLLTIAPAGKTVVANIGAHIDGKVPIDLAPSSVLFNPPDPPLSMAIRDLNGDRRSHKPSGMAPPLCTRLPLRPGSFFSEVVVAQ